MKIGIIGTYLPRECGIATFTHNCIEAIRSTSEITGDITDIVVVAMNDGESYNYPQEVQFIINQDNQEDYIKAAEFLNYSDIDVCLLQHEYGIYGGDSGLYILSLIHHLKIPLVSTFHTILKEPSFLQKIVLERIASASFRVVVMSNLAAGFLKNIYQVSPEKITLIEHGVPVLSRDFSCVQKDIDNFHNKRVLFTFGLLSRNKGIETVIKALPAVVRKHPDIVYVILGNTHPAVLKHSGDEYRDYLKNLAAELNVSDHVHFINKFVTDEQLFAYLKNIEIYITPYLNEAQITSGTLSYAIGAGAAVVSTPYWHAKELLSLGRGKLFPFKDSVALSTILNKLLSNPWELAYLRKNAYQYGQHLKWPRIGSRYLELLAEASRYSDSHFLEKSTAFRADDLPVFSLAHAKRLTDDTGIVQHAKYGIPNLKEGYCLDDNARALIMTLMAYRKYKSVETLQLLPVYLSYIHYMQREDGYFRNFLSFDRKYLDAKGSEDSFGRTIWALGHLIYMAPDNSYREFATELFQKSYPVFNQLEQVRGIANTIIGIVYYLKSHPSDEGMTQLLIELTDKLMLAYDRHSTKNWHWFEDEMTYDNGILPLALFFSYSLTGNTSVKETGIKSLKFLKSKTLYKEYLTPVGNMGWYNKRDAEKMPPLFDQQAIEVMAMVLLFEEANQVTREQQYLDDMYTCFRWFLGENELHVPLYDQETSGCCDGLELDSINRNQGAESTLAYLIAHLAVVRAMENEHEYKEHIAKTTSTEFSGHENSDVVSGSMAYPAPALRSMGTGSE